MALIPITIIVANQCQVLVDVVCVMANSNMKVLLYLGRSNSRDKSCHPLLMLVQSPVLAKRL